MPGFQNYTGATQADLLRLNLADPADGRSPNPIGLVAGDPAGFPNGRRIVDDVVAIELRAVAGATIPLVDPSYTPDGARRAAHRTARATPTLALLATLPLPGQPRRRLPERARHAGGLTRRERKRCMATAENPHAGQGPVLLDIGGDIGALVVSMPAPPRGSRWRSVLPEQQPPAE